MSAALLAMGCGGPPWRTELFSIKAPDAQYPVMLSKHPAKNRGRKVEARSGVDASQYDTAFKMGSTMVLIHHHAAESSELPAHRSLLRSVRRGERWIQIESARFFAADKSTFAGNAQQRELSLTGTVHR